MLYYIYYTILYYAILLCQNMWYIIITTYNIIQEILVHKGPLKKHPHLTFNQVGVLCRAIPWMCVLRKDPLGHGSELGLHLSCHSVSGAADPMSDRQTARATWTGRHETRRSLKTLRMPGEEWPKFIKFIGFMIPYASWFIPTVYRYLMWFTHMFEWFLGLWTMTHCKFEPATKKGMTWDFWGE